jgi:hypothetical protein
MSNLPIFKVFAVRNAATLVQVRHQETRALIDADDLRCYRAIKTLSTPWHRISIPARARLYILPEAANRMLKAGTIEEVMDAPLVRRRDVDRRRNRAEVC